MNIITINSNSFLSGTSLSDFYSNGGFSPNSVGFEVDRGSNLGVLLPGRSLTNYSTSGTTLSGNVLTSINDGNNGVYYLATSTGNIYQSVLYPVSHTLKDSTIGTPSHSYIYKGFLFITTSTDIYYTDTGFTVKNKTWWTGTQGKTALTSGVPHKIIEFQGVMYITNGNKLASWDGSTSVNAALTLPTGWIITDAIVDNDTIYMAASFLSTNNDYAPKTKIFGWNTFTPATWQKEVDVFTGVITAMIKADVTGQRRSVILLFSGTGLYLLSEYYGTFTCNWIRNFNHLPNFNGVAIANGNVYFANNGHGIASYNTHFNTLTYPVYYASTIDAINIGYLDYIDIFTDAANMYRADLNGSANTPNATFYSNRYDLQNGKIRQIIIGFNAPLPTGSTYTLSIVDETGATAYSEVISNSNKGSVSVVVISNIAHAYPINIAQLKLAFNNSANVGINFIKIFFEPSEMYVNR
jgi:hypothetical protein